MNYDIEQDPSGIWIAVESKDGPYSTEDAARCAAWWQNRESWK